MRDSVLLMPHNRRNILYLFLIGCLLAALFTGRAFFFNLSFVLAGLLLLAFIWSWLAIHWLQIQRRTRTRRAQVGHPLSETFTVRNTSLLPKLMLEIDDYSGLPGHRASQVIPLLGPRASYRWSVETECIVRGQFELGPIGITAGDPFGLFQRERRTAGGLPIIVYPRTVPVPRFESPAGVLSGGEPRRRRSQTITTNASGVREYVTGDAFNRIHWASTARKERMMVKEFEIDPLADVWLFVDFSPAALAEVPGLLRVNGSGAVLPRTPGEVPPSTEEYAVVVAASLATYFIEHKRALGFAAYVPKREAHQAERGHRQLFRVLEALAIARSEAPFSLAQMLSLEAPYLSRGTTVLLVTASLDPAWVLEAQILARKGMRPMALFIDPGTFGAPGDASSLRSMLHLAKIPILSLRRGDDISAVLSTSPR